MKKNLYLVNKYYFTFQISLLQSFILTLWYLLYPYVNSLKCAWGPSCISYITHSLTSTTWNHNVYQHWCIVSYVSKHCSGESYLGYDSCQLRKMYANTNSRKSRTEKWELDHWVTYSHTPIWILASASIVLQWQYRHMNPKRLGYHSHDPNPRWLDHLRLNYPMFWHSLCLNQF